MGGWQTYGRRHRRVGKPQQQMAALQKARETKHWLCFGQCCRGRSRVGIGPRTASAGSELHMPFGSLALGVKWGGGVVSWIFGRKPWGRAVWGRVIIFWGGLNGAVWGGLNRRPSGTLQKLAEKVISRSKTSNWIWLKKNLCLYPDFFPCLRNNFCNFFSKFSGRKSSSFGISKSPKNHAFEFAILPDSQN